MTQLVCCFKLSHKVTDDEADKILSPLKKTFRRILQRFHGFMHYEYDERMIACFNYPERLELHIQKATEAALWILRIFQDYRKKSKNKSLFPNVYLTVHTCQAIIQVNNDEHKSLFINSPETTRTYKELERLKLTNKLLVSKKTYTKIEDFFDFKAVYDESAKEVSAQKIVAHQVINKKNKQALLVPTNVKDIPLVGRKTEFKTLRSTWESITKGIPKIVKLQGMPGIGKSRLIYELLCYIEKQKDYVPTVVEGW